MTTWLQAYLLAFAFWVAIPVGALALIMLYQLVGGRWGVPAQKTMFATLQTMPLFLVLLIPILLGAKQIYPWTWVHDAVIDHKHAYLNLPFFAARSIGYLCTWTALALPLSHARPQPRRAGVGIVVLFLTVSFAAIDWWSSLEPHWHSTIYGLIYCSVAVVIALAFVIFFSADEADSRARGDLGNLLLAAIMLLAYMALSQLIIIWSGNLPDENSWYLSRAHPHALVVTAVFLTAVVPFFFLVNRRIKANAKSLKGVALLVLIGSAVHLFWLIAPAFSREHLFSGADVVMFVVFGAIWLAVFFWRQRSLS